LKSEKGEKVRKVKGKNVEKKINTTYYSPLTTYYMREEEI